jgi:tetratricopeptide (TPR) repeat protein
MARLAVLMLLLAWATMAGAAAVAPGRGDLAARQAALQDLDAAPGPVRRALFGAGAHLQRDDTDGARALLRKHLAEHPDRDHHLIRHQLALLLAQADSLDAAAVQLEAAVRLEPDLQPAWRNLGELAYGTGDYARSAEAFGRAVALDPADDPQLRYYEAASLLQAGRPADALARLESLLDDHAPSGLDWHRLLLAAALAADRADAVSARMTALTDRWPDDPQAWLLSAGQAQAASDFVRAVRALTVADYLEPLGRSDRMLLGDLCRAVDAPARAAGHYAAAIAMTPDPSPADLDRLVAAHLAAFATDEALAALDRRLALEPAATAWRLKGEVLYAEGRWTAALGALDEAAAMDPDDARVDLLRGFCGLELERTEQARRHLRAALRDESTAARARAALDHLERVAARAAP